MCLRLNDIVPDFAAESNQGEIRFHEWIGDAWVILFSHPKNFTPVCTTELAAVAQLADEWTRRRTKVIGISVDGLAEHRMWLQDIENYAGASVTFPVIADSDLAVSKAFGMLPSEACLPERRSPADSGTVRSVFVIGPDRRLKLSLTYPMSVGRNFAEILRALDALQAAESHGVATPADWSLGEDVIIPPGLDDASARLRYGRFSARLPYLRLTPMPV